jgi:hypothetical protein
MLSLTSTKVALLAPSTSEVCTEMANTVTRQRTNCFHGLEQIVIKFLYLPTKQNYG